jgi:hypothetical protein
MLMHTSEIRTNDSLETDLAHILDVTGGEISVKTDSYAFGIVICELLTGLNPMAKPLGQLVECALEDEKLAAELDDKIEWRDADLAVKLATIAVNCSAGRKDKRATAQVRQVAVVVINPNPYVGLLYTMKQTNKNHTMSYYCLPFSIP